MILDHGFGRRAAPDERDRRFLMRETVFPHPLLPPRPRQRPYNLGASLDQGQTSQCFPPGTLVQRANGSYAPIEDLKLLDEVVTAEGRTGRVTQLFVRFTDQMVRIVSRGHCHLRLTPEHPVLTARGYVSAKDLSPGDEIAMTRFAPHVIDEVRVDQWLSSAEIARVPRSIVRHGVVGRSGSVTMVAPMVQHLKLTSGMGRLFGLFLAEGFAQKHQISWAFNSDEADLIEETGCLLQDELGISARVQERPNHCTVVVAGGVSWAKLFRGMFSTGSASKGIGVLAAGPESFREGLLSGWLDGDGYTRRYSRQGVTVSHRLVMDMYGIAQTMGYRPTVRRSEPAISHNVKSRRTRWDLEFSPNPKSPHSRQDEHAVWRRVQKLMPVEYFGPVYNMHIEGDESYVAEGIGVHNCVGYSCRDKLASAPFMVHPDQGPSPFEIYKGAQDNDEWEGEYEGTSVRGGFKFLQKQGYLASYVWASSLTDCERFIRDGYGTIVLGTDWLEGMAETDAKGFVQVTGDVLGGHAYHLFWMIPETQEAWCKNSWGPSFGIMLHGRPGCFKLSYAGLETLLSRDGEAGAGIEIKVR